MPASPSTTARVALLLFVASSLLVSAEETVQGESTEQATTAENGPQESSLREKVTVSAEGARTVPGPRGAALSVVDPADLPVPPASLAGVVSELPGVSENGQGGLFQVVSIRGVSRQRLTSLIAGMRLTSERRAGVSTSFVDPLLMGSVEVLRGPATSFHGSGALGGVMQVLPRSFDAPAFDAGYSTDGDETWQAFGIGGRGWSVGLAHRQAQDSEAADGTPLHSRFDQTSAVLRWNGERNGWRHDLLAIPTYAEGIGKANTDFPRRVTDYPLERHQLFRYGLTAPAGWRLQLYAHAQDLETVVVDNASLTRSTVLNDSLDLGARWDHEKPLGSGTHLRFGGEAFARRGVDAAERREDFDPAAPADPVFLHSLDGGRRNEGGAYGALLWKWGKATWQAGGRFSWSRLRNGGGAGETLSAWNGFADATWPLSEKLELRASIDSGLRFPSLTELFFTGTTGRGEVIGNPGLDPERALNGELTLRWLGKRLFFSGALFRNRIEDYIERVDLDPDPDVDLLTFRNLSRGKISGLEWEGIFVASERWKLSLSAHALSGRETDPDTEQTRLADIPPDRIRFGVSHTAGAWSIDSSLAYRASKRDVGSGERDEGIDAAWLLDATLRRSISDRWSISASGINLLDEEYIAAADRKAPLSPGRAFALRVSWQGP